MKPKVELNLFNYTEAATYLGVDRKYINFLIESGDLVDIQLPNRSSFKGRRIPRKVLDDFIDRMLEMKTKGDQGIEHLIQKYVLRDQQNITDNRQLLIKR
jgi:archaellum biogenesis protein FlaJ (TadC family)